MALAMRSPFTPRARETRAEVLDDPRCDAELRERSLTDVSRANRLLGGTRAVLAEIRALLPELARLGREVTLLDVGTGIGDIPAAARAMSARAGVPMRAFGVDEAASLARASVARLDGAIAGNALALPIATSAVDIAMCSQVLHHFPEDAARQLLAELDRVARHRVIVSDIRRSWVAACGLWVVSFPMGFHPVSRADGMLSVLKGFTAPELRSLVHDATGIAPVVHRRLGWRLTTSWRPA